MSTVAERRLMEERKTWRLDHPHGFFARMAKNKDDSNNVFKWETGIPGKVGTDWEGGQYKVTVYFGPDYPCKPPVCKFEPVIFHPNVFSCGTICLSILKDEPGGWSPGITIKQLLTGIQELLNEPNPRSPANGQASDMFVKKKADYSRKIKQQAAKFAPDI